jgi:LysR family transcriptional regulator, low CO2-responsive transcriptional regulator
MVTALAVRFVDTIAATRRTMAITLTQLTSFLAVIRGGSVTAAADELVVTQPSVSAAVGSLERELGCELLQRAGRGIRPTEAGLAFAPYAADVIGLLDQGRQAALEASSVAARSLRIAAVTTAAESFVPALMRAFADEQSHVELTLDVANRKGVLERVLAHAADVAICGTPPGDERLAAEPLMDNEIVCVTAPDDPLAGGAPLGGPALTERVWLLREPGSGTRLLNERYLATQEATPRTLTLGSNGAIKQAVRSGLGVSLLSRVTVETELASGLLGELRLQDPPPTRAWFVVRSAIGPVREVVDAFMTFAQS